MLVLDQTSGLSYATLSAAISGSSANDVLLVPAGIYVEDFPSITHNLTIDAVGGLASLSNPQSLPPNGRAVLNVPFDAGVSLSISGLEISGANNNAIGFDNGAGILFEIGNGILTVSHSWIHGNQDGILTGGPDAASPGGVMSVFIDHSEINDNGVPPGDPRFGFDHNIYAGSLTSLSVTNSYIHDALGGHEIKSRALTTIIVNNRIQDGPTAPVSYSVDLSDGGVGTIRGNVIEKGASAANRYFIDFGGEGTYPDSELTVSDNVFINDRGPGGATGLLNPTGVPARIKDNTFYGVNEPDLFTDPNGAPFDIALANQFLPAPGPALDTSDGFDVPEPAAADLLLFAVLSIAVLRRRRLTGNGAARQMIVPARNASAI